MTMFPKPAKRKRDQKFLDFVHTLPCCLNYTKECWGRIEANHAGRDRSMGRKSDDDATIALCTRHHGDCTSHHGFFYQMNKEQRREWLDARIAETRAAYVVWRRHHAVHDDCAAHPELAAECPQCRFCPTPA